MASSPIALAALVGANLFPLVGVLLFDWSLFVVMMLYWAENGVIGAFNILKMLSASEGGWWRHLGSRLFSIPFFTFHYGLFWFGHGVFIIALFGGETNTDPGFTPASILLMLSYVPTLALLSLVASHGVSFITNFLGQGEHVQTDPHKQMFQPYGRVMILHVAILVGGIGAQALGEPIVVLLLFVLLKTGVDVSAHMLEHQAFQQDEPKTPPAPAS